LAAFKIIACLEPGPCDLPAISIRIREPKRVFTTLTVVCRSVCLERADRARRSSRHAAFDPIYQQSQAVLDAEREVTSLQRFMDAGVNEIATYGSTPGQNAKLVATWRER
jgi:hypothetical protein